MAKVLITGSSGMVGRGVLLEALEDRNIETIYLLNRRSLGMDNAKIKELLLTDFTQIESLMDQVESIDACFHCMGVSAFRMKEEDYIQYTFNISLAIADFCYRLNPDMTFVYVSGMGSDSSEKGNVMWARVKGRSENAIRAKGFKQAIMFRPGVILPEKGIKSRTALYQSLYALMRPFFPLFRLSKNVTTTTRIGQAMLHSLNSPIDKQFLNNQEINQIAALR